MLWCPRIHFRDGIGVNGLQIEHGGIDAGSFRLEFARGFFLLPDLRIERIQFGFAVLLFLRALELRKPAPILALRGR